MPLCELRYFSSALAKHTGAMVILPSYELKGPFHVMFLLHGLSDDYSIWLRRTRIEAYVEGMPLIIVMPDGGRGFYSDAVEGFAYEKAIMHELPEVIRATFHTKEPWCVSGLSMGGYGAAKLALKSPELFVSGHSLSGAVAFGTDRLQGDRDEAFVREFTRVLGPEPKGGPNDLFAVAKSLPNDRRPRLRVDCGVDDFLIEGNRAFNAHLTSIGFEHEYEEFPGAHTWDYWDLHIQESLQFHRQNLGF